MHIVASVLLVSCSNKLARSVPLGVQDALLGVLRAVKYWNTGLRLPLAMQVIQRCQ